jgi:D-Tyr-tRNAtyr deacylase
MKITITHDLDTDNHGQYAGLKTEIVTNAGAVAEMMLLRQSANSLSEACSFLVDRLTDAIGDENEVMNLSLKDINGEMIVVSFVLIL